MKKIAILTFSLFLVLAFSFCTFAGVATTAPEEGESTSVPVGYEDGLVREVDLTVPITACLIAVCGFIVYGIVKIKKTPKDDLKL